jgi:Bacterial Ig-like domain (group 2)
MKTKSLKHFILISGLGLITLASCTPYQVNSVSLNKTSTTLLINQSDSLVATLKATGDVAKAPLNWYSSDETIADVDDYGSIIGNKVGTATITAESGGKSATCQVTVINQVPPINFNGGELDYYSKLPFFSGETTNNFVLSLYGLTDTLNILVNTAPTFVKAIPNTTYNVTNLTSMTNFSSLQPLNITPGFTSSNGVNYGTWLTNNNYSLPIKTGSMTYSFSNQICTISYNLVDSFGNTLTGTYKDSLDYNDNSGQSYPVRKLLILTKAKKK